VRERTGLEVPKPSPQFDMAVKERMRRLGHASEADYVNFLRGLRSDAEEWLQIIDAGTNRLTHFFRDDEQLQISCDLLQEMAVMKGGRPLQVWSAGCSTGEEPYSMVMLAHLQGVVVNVCGSDINELALAVARRGVYANWSLRDVPEPIRKQCFISADGGSYEVKGWVRDRTSFRQHNLIQDPVLPALFGSGWDLIICRNVTIYYSESVVASLLRRLEASLVETGVLILGASETVSGRDVALSPKMAAGRVVYTPSRSRNCVPALTSPPSEPVPASVAPESIPHSIECPSERYSKTLPPEAPALASYAQIREQLVEAMTSGNVSECLVMLQEVVEKHAHDVLANLTLGHLHLMLNDYEHALRRYEAVVKIEPTLPEAHYFVGLTLRKQRKYAEALPAFRRAVFLEPTFWCASYQLGAMALRVGKRALQVQEWRRTLDLLTTGEGTLPLISHPCFCNAFLVPASEVIAMCQTALHRG
jgi:chemotaxis protein methyltransferase CheR